MKRGKPDAMHPAGRLVQGSLELGITEADVITETFADTRPADVSILEDQAYACPSNSTGSEQPFEIIRVRGAIAKRAVGLLALSTAHRVTELS